DAVKIIECPRDAWQGLKRQIPTLQKVEYLRRLVDAGFRHIDAVSFVSPKVVPQMADSEAVVEQLGPLEGVEIIGIVVNEKGAERAIATGAVSTLGYPYSISETFLRRNQNQSLVENAAVLERIRDCADKVGVHLHSTPAGARAKVLAAYDAGCRRFDSAIGGLGGCPFAQDKLVGNVPTEEVLGTLQERGLNLPIDLSKVAEMNSAISGELSSRRK